MASIRKVKVNLANTDMKLCPVEVMVKKSGVKIGAVEVRLKNSGVKINNVEVALNKYCLLKTYEGVKTKYMEVVMKNCNTRNKGYKLKKQTESDEIDKEVEKMRKKEIATADRAMRLRKREEVRKKCKEDQQEENIFECIMNASIQTSVEDERSGDAEDHILEDSFQDNNRTFIISTTTKPNHSSPPSQDERPANLPDPDSYDLDDLVSDGESEDEEQARKEVSSCFYFHSCI